MNISSLSGLTALQQQQNIQKTSSKLGAAIASLVSGNKVASGGVDVASLSIASQLQSATSGLKQVAGNLAQASSLAQVADGGLLQLQNIAEAIKNLAQQASAPALSDANRAALDTQLKQLLKQIDGTVSSTSFNGKKLLNGDVSGSNKLSLDSLLSSDSNGESGLSITSLTSTSLLGSGELNFNSTASAAGVSAAAGAALSKITGIRADVGSFLQSVDYAAASIDSAVANQEAARSTLQDTDFAEVSSQKSQATLQNNAAIALAAQGNRIPVALLQLVG